METFTITYHKKVVTEDIPRLNGAWKKKIKLQIEKKLLTDPLHYAIPLRRNLHGYQKLRIGDYRVVFVVVVEKKLVRIVAIRHRRDVYSGYLKTRIN